MKPKHLITCNSEYNRLKTFKSSKASFSRNDYGLNRYNFNAPVLNSFPEPHSLNKKKSFLHSYGSKHTGMFNSRPHMMVDI